MTGYDADEQLYYFSSSNGSTWTSPTRHGDGMTRASGNSSRISHEEGEDAADLGTSNMRSDGYQPLPNPFAGARNTVQDGSGYRQLYPFFLLIGVVLLLCMKFILFPGIHGSKPTCPANSTPYMVEPGNTCWAISREHGISLEELQAMNSDKDCAALLPGSILCIPTTKDSTPGV